MKQLGEVCRYFGVICAVLISGCAAIDPGNVGRGPYFQMLNASGAVVIENDSAKNGYMNCPNAANSMISSNPALKGRVLCAQQPTTVSLPFHVRVHAVNSPARNEFHVTSPFTTQFATSSLCEIELKTRKQDSKWIILESNCSASPVAASPSVKSGAAESPTNLAAQQGMPKAAAANQNSRYLRMSIYGDILGQFDLTNSQQCDGELEGIKKMLDNKAKDKIEFTCTTTDVKLPFRATVKDELLDNLITYSSKTKPFCLVMSSQIAKVFIPEINKPRYSLLSQCL